MEYKDFAKPMVDLGNAYRGRFAINVSDSKEDKRSVMETWYRYLGRYEPEIWRDVVDRWIETQSKPPTINELTKKCRDIQDKMFEGTSVKTMTVEEWERMVDETY